MTKIAELFETVRALLLKALAYRSKGKRNVVILALALFIIPMWQRGFLEPGALVPTNVNVTASTGVHGEKNFFFFLYHLGLLPLKTTAPILADTKEEAQRQIRENGPGLVVDEGITFRSGDRGRIYLYYPDVWANHNSTAPHLQLGNAIGFWLGLCALFAGFWWIHKPWMGAIAVLLLGSDPFQLFVTYRQENVFSWAITTALLMMGMHLPLMTRRPPTTRWIWAVPVAAGIVLATARTIRAEVSLMGLSVVLVYMTLAGAQWRKRVGMAVAFVVTLTLGTQGYVKYFEHKFQQSHAVMVAAGGTPYTGPLQVYHEIWHPIFCGLGDFDKKYGYQWEDRVGYAWAYPILIGKYGMTLPPWKPGWYTFNSSYDGGGKYPIYFAETAHYNDIIRDKVLGDIRKDPLWYLDILKKRAWRILTQTSPLAIHVTHEPLSTTSAILGLMCLPLVAFLALARRWTLLKMFAFTLPLTAPAFVIFSDLGMTNYSTYHYFGVVILCSILATGARDWLRKPVDD